MNQLIPARVHASLGLFGWLLVVLVAAVASAAVAWLVVSQFVRGNDNRDVAPPPEPEPELPSAAEPDEDDAAREHKLIQRLLQQAIKSHMTARGYQARAAAAIDAGDDEAFKDNAIRALTYAFNCLSLLEEAGWRAEDNGLPNPLAGRNTHTEIGRATKKIVYTLHNVPGCPHNDHVMIAPQLQAFQENRKRHQMSRLHRVMVGSDADAALALFDDLAAEAECLLEEEVAPALEDGDPQAARDAARDAWSYGLNAMTLHYRFLALKGDDASDIDRKSGSDFEQLLLRYAAKDGLPDIHESDAWQAYAAAKQAAGR